MEALGADKFRTQDSKDMSEEAERLNDSCWDLEQDIQALGHPQYLTGVRQNIFREREAFSRLNHPVPREVQEAAIRHLRWTFIQVCAKQLFRPTSRWEIPRPMHDDFATDHE